MHRFWETVTRPLLEALHPKTMLEIGAEDGLHTRLLLPFAAETGAHLTVVDPVKNERLDAVLSRHPAHVTFVGRPSLEALPALDCPGVALIDGDHNWFTVYHELSGLADAAERTGAPFPVCLFHDIGWPYARRDLYYDPERIPVEYRHPFQRAGIVPGLSALDEQAGLNRNYLNASEEGTPRNGVLTAVEDFRSGFGEPLALFLLPVMAGYGVLIREAVLAAHPAVARLLQELTAEGAQLDLMGRVDDDRIAQVIKLEEKRIGEVYLRGKVDEERQARERVQRDLSAKLHAIEQIERDLRERQAELKAHQLEILREQAQGRLLELRDRVRDLVFVLDAGRLHEATNDALLRSSRWKAGDRLVTVVEALLRMPRQSQSPVHMADAHAHLAAARDQLEQLGGRGRVKAMKEALTRAKDEQAIVAVRRDLEEMQQDVCRLLRQSMEAFERAQEFSAFIQRSKRWRLGALVMGFAAKASPRPVPTTLPAAIDTVGYAYRAWKGGGALPAITPLPKVAGAVPANAEKAISRALVDSIRVTQFTPPAPRNPFFTLVPKELTRRGWHFDYMTDREALLARVRQGEFEHEIVLFHHLDPLYHDRGGDPAKTAENGGRLIAYLEALRDAGARIVYNAHNPVPHASPNLDTDLKVQDAMHRLATRIIVLGHSAADDLAAHAPRSKLAVLHHPTFAGHYGPPVARDAARSALGLPADAVILGSVGELKPYKGISLMIEGYRRFREACPAANGHLIVAGREGKPGYADEIRSELPPDATLHAKEIPDSELPLWLSAIDLGVFSFERMWVSSSVLLSLSYGSPVIAPDVGCIHEYAPEEDRGFLYEPGSAESLAAAIARAVSSPLLPHMRYMCGVFNKKYQVGKIADRYEAFYASVAELPEESLDV